MAKTKTSKKSSTKKMGMKERMAAKREELKNKGRDNILKQKEEGTIRVRILPTGEENDWMQEIIMFWLDGSIVSPQTFDEPCPIMEKYLKLKDSKKDADKDLAKAIMPKKKQVIPVLWYKDDKGKKIDKENSGKLLQITNQLSQAIIDLYLDDDEWGDMTDAKDGYDLKITRDGLKMTDTTYTVQPCKNTPIDKAYRKPIDLEALVKDKIDSYEDCEEKLATYLNSADDDDDDKGKKKKKKSKGKDKPKKKKRKKDI